MKYEYTLDYAWDTFCKNVVNGRGEIKCPFGVLERYAIETLGEHYNIRIVQQNDRMTTYLMEIY